MFLIMETSKHSVYRGILEIACLPGSPEEMMIVRMDGWMDPHSYMQKHVHMYIVSHMQMHI